MFLRNQNKPKIIVNTNTNTEQIKDLFDSIEKKDENKLIEYINNPEYKIWEMKDENGNTILHKSCFHNYKELSLKIIQEIKKRLGSQKSMTRFINEKNSDGLTALHYIAYKGNVELAKILIEYDASVDCLTKLGKNVVHLSSEGNEPSMMIYFLNNHGLDVYTGDENGSSPLHWACYSGAEESVNFLIGLNCNINAVDKEKLTPLHLATLYNRENIVIKLLQNGADKSLKNSKGELPIDIARKKNFHSIVNILEDKDYNPLYSLDPPLTYIKPNNIYKKFIIVMIVVPEILIILMILPYLENIVNILLNNIFFIIVLILIITLFYKNPGYKINYKLINESFSGNNDYPLIKLVDNNIDIKYYCPKCYGPESNNIKHCFICDKCIDGFVHHCFWLNKCIGRGNKIYYFLFMLFIIIFAFHSMFICLLSLLDYAYIPYEKLIYKAIFKIWKDREIRVLSTAIIFIFSVIASFPLTFLFFNEIQRYFTYKKAIKSLDLISVDDNQTNKDNEFELEINDKKSKNKNNENELINENILTNNNENNNDFLGLNRSTNNDNEREIMLGANNNVPIPQTPFSVDKKISLVKLDDDEKL